MLGMRVRVGVAAAPVTVHRAVKGSGEVSGKPCCDESADGDASEAGGRRGASSESSRRQMEHGSGASQWAPAQAWHGKQAFGGGPMRAAAGGPPLGGFEEEGQEGAPCIR